MIFGTIFGKNGYICTMKNHVFFNVFIKIGLMVEIVECDMRVMEMVESAVCGYFKEDISRVVGRDTGNGASLARGFVFYILSRGYGMPYSKIALRYGRTYRAVQYVMSKMGYLVGRVGSYAAMYGEIKRSLGLGDTV